MRSYHKHSGVTGSHKIAYKHKDELARKYHNKEIEAYNKANGIKTVKKAVKKSKPKTNTIELPVKNGIIQVDLTKTKNKLFVKFRDNDKVIELLIGSN